MGHPCSSHQAPERAPGGLLRESLWVTAQACPYSMDNWDKRLLKAVVRGAYWEMRAGGASAALAMARSGWAVSH